MIQGLTPKQIVKKLDEFIIGQEEAKKSVSIALRNRSRRMALGDDPLKDDIHPKNIIMIGPTGVGKTEIARRLAKLVYSPFVKIEATKYTEVGYVGRDVESMIRDLVNTSLKMVRCEHEKQVIKQAGINAENRIIDILVEGADKGVKKDSITKTADTIDTQEESIKSIFRKKLQNGLLEEKEIKIKASSPQQPTMQIMAMPGLEEVENQMQNILGDFFPKKKKNKTLKIKHARKMLIEEEIENLLDFDKIKAEAIERAEQNGIIFIDEIDKIVGRSVKGSADVSREGVQRDILPLVEGSTVNTRYGQVRTDHVLFIAAGAFHVAQVSDLIPELQGRFPIRVELKALQEKDYMAILQNPKNALSKQYQALLSTEEIILVFENSGYKAISQIAHQMNMQNENIGARRLHTIMEKLLEDVSFDTEKYSRKEICIDDKFVEKQLKNIVEDQDISKYIL